MRFAVLGDHEDGQALAQTLVQTGRHTLIAVLDIPVPSFAPYAVHYSDLEEILADPTVEAVIIAGKLDERGAQLRRALQAERDVFCVVPCAASIDRVYEAALIHNETKKLLLPMLPTMLHPRLVRWREELAGPLTLLKWELPAAGRQCRFTGWGTLRQLGGEIAEVTAITAADVPTKPGTLYLTGRFESAGMFQITMGPDIAAERLAVQTGAALVQLDTKADDAAGQNCFDPWLELVNEWEAQRAGAPARLTWLDAIRVHELDDALQRSLDKRRTESLDYQEVSADVGSKGTITLIGCGMIWLMLLIFGLSIWVPWVRWAVVPLIVGFLGLVLVRTLGKTNQAPNADGKSKT